MSWTISDSTLGGSPFGGVDNVSVTAYRAVRFSSPPAMNASPPGASDVGPVTTGTTWGSDGAFQMALPNNEDYYVAFTLNGITLWKLYPCYVGAFLNWTDSRVGGRLDGVTDNGGGVNGTNALAKAYALLGAAGGTVTAAPGVAVFSTAPGARVPSNFRLEGAGKNATVFKKTYNGVFLDFSGTSSSNRCQRGGLSDIQLNGNGSSSGTLLQMIYADHLNFDRVWCNLNGDNAVIATELWDTYFRDVEFEWCGTGAFKVGAVVRIQGSSTGSSNEIYFSQCRWESFPGHALMLDSQGLGNAPYGIWLSQCKMESAQANNNQPFIETTSDISDVRIRDLYMALDAGSMSTSTLIDFSGYGDWIIEGLRVWVATALSSVFYIFSGPVGHAIRDIHVDGPVKPTVGIFNWAGGNQWMRVENISFHDGTWTGIHGGTIPSNAFIVDAVKGRATLVAGTVTVANARVTATSNIKLTSQVDGGSPGFLRVSARTPGTSFTITSSNAADTSTVFWEMYPYG